MTNKDVNVTAERMTLNSAFEKTKELVDKVLSSSPLIIKTYTEHLKQSNGKFIRAWSLLVCAMDEDNNVHEDAVTFAASIEIIHLATLVHDDVMDDASLRRGVITLQKKYGKKTAVICGDYLLITALKLLNNVKNKEDYKEVEILNCMDQVCLGELKQHVNNRNMDLSFYNYLSIISKKTAELFKASFYAGAVVCNKSREELRSYCKLGKYIGMIFQLTDDCIDFEIEEEVAKKNVQSDYEQGVITLPLIYIFDKVPELKAKAKRGELMREEINLEVKRYGGLDFTKLISKKYYNKSVKLINSIDMTNEKKIELKSILNKSYYGPKKK